MQEAITNPNDSKTLFTSYLEVLEAKEKEAEAERQLQEEKYLRRTRRIYEIHERQLACGAEMRMQAARVCERAALLDSALRASASGDGETAPLSRVLLRHAAMLLRTMLRSLASATALRRTLSPPYHHHMDTLLRKMEEKVKEWVTLVDNASAAVARTDSLLENMRNLAAEQQRVLEALKSQPNPTQPQCSTPLPRRPSQDTLDGSSPSGLD